MKLRDAMERALERTNTPKELIVFAMSFADVLWPDGSISSLAEIQSGYEEECIQKMAKALTSKSRKAQKEAWDFCDSKAVKPGNN